MAINLQSIERRTRKAYQHAGYVFTYGGIDYDCAPSGMRDTELRNREQTFRENYQASIVFINNDVTLSIGDKITYKGSTRRVLDIGDTGDGVQRILHLGNEFGAR